MELIILGRFLSGLLLFSFFFRVPTYGGGCCFPLQSKKTKGVFRWATTLDRRMTQLINLVDPTPIISIPRLGVRQTRKFLVGRNDEIGGMEISCLPDGIPGSFRSCGWRRRLRRRWSISAGIHSAPG